MKYIHKVGVELEGGWTRRPLRDVINEDLSVRVSANHVGEMPSPPFETLEKLEEWLTPRVPDVVDLSCGFHIHCSLKSKNYYMWLTTPRFQRHLLIKLKKWGLEEGIPKEHHFWKRWKGTFRNPNNNRNYCRKDFIPEKQLFETTKRSQDREGPRHCILNFCLSMHGTVELRMPPAWEKEVSHRYMGVTKVFVEAIESFIEKEKVRKSNRIRIKIDPFRLKRREMKRKELAA